MNLKDEDSVYLKSVGVDLVDDSGLDVVLRGNNSQDDKKEYFTSLFRDLIGDYYSERMDFYKTINHPKVFPMIIDVMFQETLKMKGL